MDTQPFITDQHPTSVPNPTPATFSEPKSTRPSRLPLIILGILTLIFATSSVYFFTKLRKVTVNAPSVSVTIPSPTPTASLDPTEDWKVYQTTEYSLKYPSDIVQVFENINDTTALKSNEAIMIGVPNSDSLALRLYIYPSKLDPVSWWENIGTKKYEKLVADFVQVSNPPPSPKPFAFTQKHLKLGSLDTLEVTGYIDAAQRAETKITIFRSNDKIFMFEQSFIKSEEMMKNIGDQILTTFKFTDTSTKYSLEEISQACIKIRNSSKYWISKYKECISPDGTTTSLKDYCTKYGGQFTENGDTCRHALEEGLPCGPSMTSYCSF